MMFMIYLNMKNKAFENFVSKVSTLKKFQ